MAQTKQVLAQALAALELLCGSSRVFSDELDDSGYRDQSDNEIFEIRIFAPGINTEKPRSWTGYFNSPHSAYDAISNFGIDWSAAYFTLNPVDTERFAIAPNCLIKAGQGLSTSGEHITRRRRIVVDIDPVRGAFQPGLIKGNELNREAVLLGDEGKAAYNHKQPSSDEEKAHALEVTKNISRFCQLRGMPEPIIGDSGNGYHLIWFCDIPRTSPNFGISADTGNLHLRMLNELASKFNSYFVDVDLSVCDPNRIWRVYGTLSRKGVSSETRKFRFSKIIHTPDLIEEVSEEQIYCWLPNAGKESKVLKYGLCFLDIVNGRSGEPKVYNLREADNRESGAKNANIQANNITQSNNIQTFIKPADASITTSIQKNNNLQSNSTNNESDYKFSKTPTAITQQQSDRRREFESDDGDELFDKDYVKKPGRDIVYQKLAFDGLAKLTSWGLQTYPAINKGSMKVHELKTCPCSRQLKDRTSALYVLESGAVSFNCQHGTCDFSNTQGNCWKPLREQFEPDYGKKPEYLPMGNDRDVITFENRIGIDGLLAIQNERDIREKSDIKAGRVNVSKLAINNAVYKGTVDKEEFDFFADETFDFFADEPVYENIKDVTEAKNEQQTDSDSGDLDDSDLAGDFWCDSPFHEETEDEKRKAKNKEFVSDIIKKAEIIKNGGKTKAKLEVKPVKDDISDFDIDGILGDLAGNPEHDSSELDDFSDLDEIGLPVTIGLPVAEVIGKDMIGGKKAKPLKANKDHAGIASDSEVEPTEAEILRPSDPTGENGKIMRAKDGRRLVNVHSDPKHIYSHMFEEITLKPDVYTSAGELAYVDVEKYCMTLYDSAGLDRLAWDSCEFVEWKKTNSGFVTKAAMSPKRVVLALAELTPNDRKYLRDVAQVSKSQFYTTDGSLVVSSGYNADAKTYLIDCPVIYDIDTVEDAVGYLHNVIRDFPFQSDSEKANFLGTWLTPMVRAMIRGPVPMTVIEANKRGTGKTKLGQVVQATYGLKPEVGGLSQDEAEVEKAMLTILNEAQPIHIFDNVTHNIKSACLDRTLTTGFYSARILGKTQNLHREVRQLFILTANNSRMNEDMSRRFVRVRLRTDLKNPERRSDISNPDLLNWISENRGMVLSCLSKLVQNWLENGKAAPDSLPRLGSYESWRNVIGGIMYAAGQTSWMANLEEAVSEALVLDEWDTFVDMWWKQIGHSPVGVKEIRTKMQALVDLCGRNGIMGNLVRGQSVAHDRFCLRNAMLDRRDTVIGEFRLKIEKDKSEKTDTYILEKLPNSNSSGNGKGDVAVNSKKTVNIAVDIDERPVSTHGYNGYVDPDDD